MTGLGATTPLGVTYPAPGRACSPAVRRPSHREDWADDLPCKIAAKAADRPREVLDRVEARRLDRVSQLR